MLQVRLSSHITMSFQGPPVLTLKRSSWSPLFLQMSGQALSQHSTQHRGAVSPGLLSLEHPPGASLLCPAQLHQCPADAEGWFRLLLLLLLPAESLGSVSHLWSLRLRGGQEGWSPHTCIGKAGRTVLGHQILQLSLTLLG